MNTGTEPISRPSNRLQVAYIPDVLTQMQRSGSIHFVKSLTKTAFQTSSGRQTAKLSLPTQFVQENDEKIEEWVILRAHSSCGRSSRPWLVRLSVSVEPLEAAKVQIVGGWPAFVAGNRLKEGNYLIFLLKEDARSEFEVYMFRGPWGSPYFPNEGERSDTEEKNVSESEEEENVSEYFPNEGERSDPEGEENIYDSEEEENVSEYFPNEGERSDPEGEENVYDSEEEGNTNNQIRHHSPVHQQEEHNRAFTMDIREGNPAPLQQTENPRAHPGFSKRLTAYNIGRSRGETNSGQFEFPKAFLRTHGGQVHDSVKLQGIHENSRDYVISCRRRPGDLLKVYFATAEWSRFVQDNGLKEGHELQFSLMAKSYFVVRKIS